MMGLNGKTVRIQVGKGIRYRNLPKKAIEKLTNDCTFRNQKYDQAIAHGGYVSNSVPPFLQFFARTVDKQTYWTPRGYIWAMKKWLNENGYQVQIDDRTLRLPELDVEFQGTLRPYQGRAVDDTVRRYPLGVLEASTGAGKTVMGTAIIARRKQPTLIIVHTKELLYQWRDSIQKFLNYDCGLVGDGKFTVKGITVGIINTVKNKHKDLVNNFGQIVIDECHRCPSNLWTETLSEFPARFYLGLSATPYRKDGLGGAIYIHIGPKIHQVDKKELQDTGAVLKPQIILAKTSYKYGRGFSDEEGTSYSTIIADLVRNEARNAFICKNIKEDLKRYKQNVLVVSDRVGHCEELQYRLKKIGVSSNLLHGKISAKKRKVIVDEVKAGKVKVLIATLNLIGEGFDAPNLAAIHLTTPIKFSGRLIQTVGRVLRPEKGKIPRVYDYRDENVKVLQNSGYSRNRIYRQQWG